MNTNLEWAKTGMNVADKATVIAAAGRVTDEAAFDAAVAAAAEALTPEGEEPTVTQSAILAALRAVGALD